ncbi:MAG TPA: ABC transporter permease [Lactobacillus sp.]|nr:ABC transporter permease [Lactobacillus sp.]
MSAIIERNVKLFFRNRVGVFFSILSTLIVLGLYIVFLKQNMVSEWHQVSHPTRLLDPWVMGGTLSVTAVTVTLDGARQYVTDQTKAALDFEVAPVSEFRRQLAYGFSAVIIGIVMQVVVYVIDALYFGLADKVYFSLAVDFKVFVLICINTIVSALLSIMLAAWIESIDTWSTLESIIATASGFLSGIYMPIGALPHFAQTIIKFYPGAYSAGLFRRILMNEPMKKVFSNTNDSMEAAFKSQLGVGYTIHGINTTFASEFMILMLFGVLAVCLIMAKIIVERVRQHRLRYN